jgi:cytosine/adenosine deaminase-related metal-dependent hydrolase
MSAHVPTAEYDLVVTGANVYCKADPQTPSAFVRRDLAITDGRFAALLVPGTDPPRARKTYQAAGRVVLPGLVNAHTHSYGQLCRHHLSDDTLEALLPGILSWSRAFDPSMYELATTLQCADSLRHGVTTILDHVRLDPGALDRVIGAYKDCGLRVAMAPQVSDRPFSQSLSAVPESIRLSVANWEAGPPPSAESVLDLHRQVLSLVENESRLSLLVGPSAADRCTIALLEGLAAFARKFGLGIHTHLLESRLQRAGVDPIELLFRTGLLTSHTSLAHGVHLLPPDVQRISDNGASVIHNPQSNLALGSGRCKPVELKRAGINVGLGTDGFNCGGSQSVLDAAKLAMILGRPDTPPDQWLLPADVWAMATEGGAAAIGLQNRVGVVMPTANADFLVVRPGDAGHFDGPDLIQQIVFGGFASGLEAVFVEGTQLTRDGRMLTIDEPSVQREASRAYARLVENEQGESRTDQVRRLLSRFNEGFRQTHELA